MITPEHIRREIARILGREDLTNFSIEMRVPTKLTGTALFTLTVCQRPFTFEIPVAELGPPNTLDDLTDRHLDRVANAILDDASWD